MAQISMVKVLGSLRPIDDHGEAVLRRYAHGEVISVEVKKPRGYKFHKKLFAMLNIILHNQDHYQTVEELLTAAKFGVHHTEKMRVKRDGHVYELELPKSVSYAAMDDHEFADFYERVTQWVLTDVIPGLERRHLDEEVREALLGFVEEST